MSPALRAARGVAAPQLVHRQALSSQRLASNTHASPTCTTNFRLGPLAEKLGFEGAYALDPETRALQKLVMRRWDDVVVPAFYRSMSRGLTPDDLRADLERELAFMADTVAKLGSGQANLPQVHLATHWSRMHWLREFSPIAELIDEHPTLRGWLDGALALPTVQSTLPDRDAVIERYRRRFFGEGAKS